MDKSLGTLLRRYRVAANLTQEELAERASISATAVASLERGRRRSPRMSTLRQLAGALGLSDEQTRALVAAARNDGVEPGVPDSPSVASPHGPERGHNVPVAHGALPRAASRRWRSTFVGRSEEMEVLGRVWTEHRRFALIAGEPGVGKTRLATEWIRRVHDDGGRVAWGRCAEPSLGPYLPFVEILRQLVDVNQEATLPIGTRGELSRLLPELADRANPSGSPSHAEAGTEQRLLFEAVAATIGASAPVLVVIDDLHWADEASVALLGYLVREPHLTRVTLAGTTWENLDPALAGSIADITRQAETSRILLRRLDDRDLRTLIGDLAGSEVPPSLVEAIADSTGGNAFFAEEMTVHLMDAGMFGPGATPRLSTDASFGVPERVRDTLAKRLGSLSKPAMDFLLAGSVIGREFSLALAGSTAGLQGAAMVDAADEGLLSGMIFESDGGCVTFSHALVQDAVNAQLSRTRQASIHRKVALLMEEQWPANPSIAAELARHWRAVVEFQPAAATTAALWSTRAGDLALASAATDEAIVRYEQASELWTTSTAGHIDSLIRLGGALVHAGRPEEADERFLRALRMAKGLGNRQLKARAAIGLGRRFPYWETDHERVAVLEDALGELSPGDELLRLTLEGLIVSQLINGFTAEEAHRRDELAAELADVACDPETPSELLLSIGRTRFFDSIEDPRVLSDAATRLTGLAEDANDLRVLAGSQFAQALAALDLADIGLLREIINHRYRETVERLGDPREIGCLRGAESTLALIEGRYADGEALSNRALELCGPGGDLNAELTHFAQGLLRAVDLGQAAEVLELLMAAKEYQRIPAVKAGTTLCAALAGDDGFVRSSLRQFSQSGFDGFPLGADRLAPIALLAHACGIVDDVDSASALHSCLIRQHARAVRIGPLIGWWGPVDHHVGVLYRVAGAFGEAERHLQRALATEQQMCARPFLARTQAELALVFSRGEGAPSADRSESLLAEARALASTLGADGITTEVSRLSAAR